jgi:hypothetical protein
MVGIEQEPVSSVAAGLAILVHLLEDSRRREVANFGDPLCDPQLFPALGAFPRLDFRKHAICDLIAVTRTLRSVRFPSRPPSSQGRSANAISDVISFRCLRMYSRLAIGLVEGAQWLLISCREPDPKPTQISVLLCLST